MEASQSSQTKAGTVLAEAAQPAAAQVGVEPAGLHWLYFGVILAVGMFFRFWRLGHQSIWCDESATALRIGGSVHHLLHTLDRQGFPPGWYMLLLGWRHVLQDVLRLPAWQAVSITWLRVLPAILGMLLVPTAYWLGRQWFSRRGALLVMLLASVNPFLIYYSRDIKMYAACYLTVTLNVAIFFQWMQTRRVWPWGLLFVFSAVAMAAIDFLSWMIIPAELLWLLLRAKSQWRWSDVPIWLGGVGLMGAMTLGWYYRFTNFASVTVKVDRAGPMGWVGVYNQVNWHTAAGLPTVHLLGFLWPTYPPTPRMLNWFGLSPGFDAHLASCSSLMVARLELAAAALLFAVLLLGLLPWHRIVGACGDDTPAAPREAKEARPGRWWHVALWLGLPLFVFGFGSLPKSSVWSVYPHFVMWQQRYLGPLAMAWILWLAAALLRLPGRALRASLTVLFVLLMAASALTSHLVCRQEPWNFIYPTALKYLDAAKPTNMLIVCTRPIHAFGDEIYALETALHRVPQQARPMDGFAHPQVGDARAALPQIVLLPPVLQAWQGVITGAAHSKSISTLVLADRWGDQKTGPFCTAAIGRQLGDGWRLAAEKHFRWFYQWWFYFYTNWRVRVWQRVPTAGTGLHSSKPH